MADLIKGINSIRFHVCAIRVSRHLPSSRQIKLPAMPTKTFHREYQSTNLGQTGDLDAANQKSLGN